MAHPFPANYVVLSNHYDMYVYVQPCTFRPLVAKQFITYLVIIKKTEPLLVAESDPCNTTTVI